MIILSCIIKEVYPVIDYSVRSLCTRPYPGHPKGCPNFNKKKKCPPIAQKFENIFDLTQPIYAIIHVFDFRSHIEKMKNRHPEWSERQLKNCYYWQSKARSKLKEGILDFLKENRNYHVTTCPEGMGINVTETMKRIGIILEWPPENLTYQVAIAGIKKMNVKIIINNPEYILNAR